MADNEEIEVPQGADQPIEIPKRVQKPTEPPVTFREFNVSLSKKIISKYICTKKNNYNTISKPLKVKW